MANITLFQINNTLSYPLSFTNIETPTDGINPLNPGVTPTPGSGGTGCLIPDCTGQQWWRTNCMIISGGLLYLNIWKENNTAYWYVGNTTTYPATAKQVLAQADGNAQQLTIATATGGSFAITMTDLPQ
jgi:hypothetical protein